MEIKKLRVPVTAKNTEAPIDAVALIDLLDDNWGAIQEDFALKAKSEDEQDALIDYFNSAVDGQEVGDKLFVGGDREDFKSKMETLNPDEKKAFV